MAARSGVSAARDGPVPPPMPALRLLAPSSGPKGSQILACSSRQPSISARICRIFDCEASIISCCSTTRALSSFNDARWLRSVR